MGNDIEERKRRLIEEIGMEAARREYENRFFEFDPFTGETKEVEADGNIFFDDCPICRAMRAAEESGRELSLPELHEAFMEAEKAGGKVGGGASAGPDWLNRRAGEA